MPGYELLGDEEFLEVSTVFQNGAVLYRRGFEKVRGDCFKVNEFEEAFAKKLQTPYALALTSGTAALRVALAAIGVESGDEVITQAFTFVATVEAIIESGATPVCTEVDKTLNMDPESLLDCISSKTKAVIVVHMLGVPARLNEIKKICEEKSIYLIEDTAWGCGGMYDGKNLGTYGDIGTFSFDYAKTITTGEGGMLTCKDEFLYKRACAWHDHGHENNPNFPRWEDTRFSSGFNFRMMELQGAVGIAQLKKLDYIVSIQRNNYQSIWNEICSIPGIYPREIPENSYCTSDALIFFVDTSEIAARCRQELLSIGVSTKILPEAYTWHFAGTWTHMPELRLENSNINFPKTRDLLTRAVSLPIQIKMENWVPEKIKKSILRAIKE